MITAIGRAIAFAKTPAVQGIILEIVFEQVGPKVISASRKYGPTIKKNVKKRVQKIYAITHEGTGNDNWADYLEKPFIIVPD